MKRGRNQRRRQGGQNPNRALDSNGPDVRIRGTANQIYDKYVALARDASSAGDRVKAENYLQHAEHYFRVIRSLQPPQQQQQAAVDAEGEQPSVDAGEDGRGKERADERGGDRRRNSRQAEAKDEKPESDQAANDEPPAEEAAAESVDKDEAPKPKRTRARRPARRKTKDADEASSNDDEQAATAAE